MRDSFCISQVKRYEHSYRSCPVYNLKRKIFKRNISLWITVIFTTNFDNDTKKIIIFFFSLHALTIEHDTFRFIEFTIYFLFTISTTTRNYIFMHVHIFTNKTKYYNEYSTSHNILYTLSRVPCISHTHKYPECRNHNDQTHL